MTFGSLPDTHAIQRAVEMRDVINYAVNGEKQIHPPDNNGCHGTRITTLSTINNQLPTDD